WTDRVANMAMAIMSKVEPEGGSAEGGLFGYAWAVLSGKDFRHNGEFYVDELFAPVGGGPGTNGFDGWINWANAACMGEIYIESIEVHEQRYPHIFEKVEVAIDSAGAGKYNGSPGIDVCYAPMKDPMTVAGFFDGGKFPIKGVLGGDGGTLNKVFVINRKTGAKIREESLVGMLTINPGEALLVTGDSGAGFGNPLERDPERVCMDVKKGFVSVEKARETYGVVLLGSDPEEFTVNYETTAKIRREKGGK
ncbi:MAG: hydantoinase B/oxoprolinase family protein, partial [Deltaproteobacteria bacterium]|nr:hydantoinase B/oxoprolinase family protein [Deltaproteobacteria bacterium]